MVFGRRRRPDSPASRLTPLAVPRLDGSTWPGASAGRSSFAAATLYSLARRDAFTPHSHAVTDAVLDHVRVLLDPGGEPEDAAYLEQVLTAAAQTGAAVGLVESRSVTVPEGAMHPDTAAVLQMAAHDLPAMPPLQSDVARFLLQCGYYLARVGTRGVEEVVDALTRDRHPAIRPSKAD